jgi:CRP-like cAMP-binding protein
MSNPLVLALARRDDLSDEEIAAIESLTFNHYDFRSGATVVAEGSVQRHSCLIVEGLAVRAHHLADGKRMISALHVAGDFVDLHSLLLAAMDHDVQALTPCKIAMVPHAEIRRVTERLPHLARLLWLLTVTDAAVHRNWIVGLGRKGPLSHLAHLMCEMYVRLDVIGLVQDKAFRLPITQMDLSDILGLSVVHVNRTLQELRGTGFLTWTGNLVTVRNWRGLADLAQFDPTYLNLTKQPR